MARIATLTMNPAVDLTVEAPCVVPTKKLRCSPVRRDPGGGGINAARAIRRLGGDVIAVFPTGRAPGAWLAKRLRREGVASLTIPIEGETREDFTAVDASSGLQYRFVLPGPKLSASEWSACLDAVVALDPPPEFLIASGSLPDGAPVDTYARVARIARWLGARLALDASGRALRAALGQGVWLMKPSLDELRELTGEPLSDEAAQVRACRDLVSAGQAEFVALTLGERGAVLVGKDVALRAAALAVRPVSAIGAGDAFLGGLVWSVAAGHELDLALRYGVAAASSALGHPGTELCDAEEVGALLPEVRVETVTPGEPAA